jgi:hypothetical protein
VSITASTAVFKNGSDMLDVVDDEKKHKAESIIHKLLLLIGDR